MEKNYKFLIFDTETTGLPKDRAASVTDVDNWPRLVQLAWLVCDNSGSRISSKNFIIKPNGFKIPDKAVEIHRITNEIANENGISVSVVLKEFTKAMYASDFLVAHNIDFDEKVLGAELIRENFVTKLDDFPKICTMKESTDYCKITANSGYKWPSLSELHKKLFKESYEEKHVADADVEACAKCFFELKRRGLINLC